MTPTSSGDQRPLPARIASLSKTLIRDEEEHRLLKFRFNLLKAVQSSASPEEYWSILQRASKPEARVGLISFPLSEYLCFHGEPVEHYEVSFRGRGFAARTHCRLDNSLVQVVYFQDGEFVEIFGRSDDVKAYKEEKLPAALKYSIAHPKTFFTIVLALPHVNDQIQDTALRRSALRFAVAGLNKFADCHRRHVGIAWSSEPHYSFLSFPYGYIREFDFDGRRVSSDKYMMNPATGFLPERPRFLDVEGEGLARFEAALLTEDESERHLNNLKKAEAYLGHGHDLVAIRVSVSAVDGILRRWATAAGLRPGRMPPEKARLKSLLGGFEAELKRRRLRSDADSFMQRVREAVNLRHEVEHAGFDLVDNSVLQPVIDTLRQFFDLVAGEVERLRRESE